MYLKGESKLEDEKETNLFQLKEEKEELMKLYKLYQVISL